MRYIAFLLTFFYLISCNQKKREYYDNGTLKKEYSVKKGKLNGAYKEYYDNGKLKLIHNYFQGKNKDSSIYFYSHTNENVGVIKLWLNDGSYYQKEFYPNGKLKKEGLVLDSTIVFGKWKNYDSSGRLKEFREYINLNGESYLNQIWNLNARGDTISSGSNFAKILLSKDTINLNEPVKAVVFLRSKFFKSNDSQIYVYLPSGDLNFTENFSNEYKIALDTFVNLTIDTANQKWYSDLDYNRVAIFGKMFDTAGDKKLRGCISEFYKTEPTKKDSSTMKERRIYFDIPIYVKDSLD